MMMMLMAWHVENPYKMEIHGDQRTYELYDTQYDWYDDRYYISRGIELTYLCATSLLKIITKNLPEAVLTT